MYIFGNIYYNGGKSLNIFLTFRSIKMSKIYKIRTCICFCLGLFPFRTESAVHMKVLNMVDFFFSSLVFSETVKISFMVNLINQYRHTWTLQNGGYPSPWYDCFRSIFNSFMKLFFKFYFSNFMLSVSLRNLYYLN